VTQPPDPQYGPPYGPPPQPPGPQYGPPYGPPPPLPPGYVYPPPGGYYPPPLPPPPRRTNNKLWIGIGAGVLVVVLLCIGSGFFLVHRAATNIARAGADHGPAEPNIPGAPNPLASLQARELHAVNSDGTPLKIGETLTVQDGVGDKVRFTISRVRFQKKACSSISGLPKGMGLLIADLTIRVDAGSMRTTEFDFGLSIPGQAKISGFEGLLSGCGEGLSMNTQRAGSTQHANLMFVTAAQLGEIVYSPLLSPTPLGSWTVG
jgi:hypothetical protein